MCLYTCIALCSVRLYTAGLVCLLICEFEFNQQLLNANHLKGLKIGKHLNDGMGLLLFKKRLVR